jgi:hypothetical protein
MKQEDINIEIEKKKKNRRTGKRLLPEDRNWNNMRGRNDIG